LRKVHHRVAALRFPVDLIIDGLAKLASHFILCFLDLIDIGVVVVFLRSQGTFKPVAANPSAKRQLLFSEEVEGHCLAIAFDSFEGQCVSEQLGDAEFDRLG